MPLISAYWQSVNFTLKVTVVLTVIIALCQTLWVPMTTCMGSMNNSHGTYIIVLFDEVAPCQNLFASHEGPGMGQNIWIIDNRHLSYMFRLVEFAYWSWCKNLATQKLSGVYILYL